MLFSTTTGVNKNAAHDPRYKKEKKKKILIPGIMNNYFYLILYAFLFQTQRAEFRDLLNSNRLSQVSWEVDVQVPKNSKPVGDKL